MYLAPLNYDRFFKKVFSELRIAKQFLEDFLGVEIQEIAELPAQHKITDAATQVEFDFRCKIDGHYVIIDMQQWYKPDVVKRFYIYHSLNSALQLERLPYKSMVSKEGKERKIRDYSTLEPVITLVWMAEDMLGFTEDYISYQLTPEMVATFIKSEVMWKKPDIQALLQERSKILQVLDNKTKEMNFLQHNQLIYLFQKNIVKNHKITNYFRWFEFAEKTKNDKNTEAEFEGYEKDEIFAEMMRRINKENLPPEDWEYVTNEAEMWERVLRYERGVEARADAKANAIVEAAAERIKSEKEAMESEKEAMESEKEAMESEKEAMESEKARMKAEKEAMEAQKDIDFVLRLDSKGKNIAEIADLTDISAETIKNILKQHKK